MSGYSKYVKNPLMRKCSGVKAFKPDTSEHSGLMIGSEFNLNTLQRELK